MANDPPERDCKPFEVSKKKPPKSLSVEVIIVAVSWRLKRLIRIIRELLNSIIDWCRQVLSVLRREILPMPRLVTIKRLATLPKPQLWNHSQHDPIRLYVPNSYLRETAPESALRIGIVTPSYNHEKYLGATIDSVLSQDYPNLAYFVQDGGSKDGTLDLLQSYEDRLIWRSEPDSGQGNAINRGFSQIDSEIMAYLNSDDVLLPGTLAYVDRYFRQHPKVDFVYGHRVNIDQHGHEIGRCVLPPHDTEVLKWADYLPQETMFWRRRVWEKVGPIDESFRFALDWDFILRAQAAGFNFRRLPRFLACFRIHEQQKTSAMMTVGHQEMARLRQMHLGHEPEYSEINRSINAYLQRQVLFHWLYKFGLLRH